MSGTNISQGVLTAVKTYHYYLTCSNLGGTSAQVDAPVQVSAVSPVATLTADRYTIYPGESVILTWSSAAASCTGTPSAFNTGNLASGSTSVTPVITTTYTLNCSDTSTAQATITVKKKVGLYES